MAELERQTVGSPDGEGRHSEAERGAPCDQRRTAAGRGTRHWLAPLCAALVGGLMGWGLVEGVHDTFEQESLPAAPGASAMNPVFDPELRVLFRRAELKNAILSLSVLGASLGGWLGSAKACADHRPSLPKAASGLASGALLGAAFGALGCYAGFTAGNALVDVGGLKPLYGSCAAQGIAWALLGLGVGLGVSLPTGRVKVMAANAGLAALAGVLSVAAWQIVAALALPAENTARIIPASTVARLTWALLSCAVVGLVLAARGTAAHSDPAPAQP